MWVIKNLHLQHNILIVNILFVSNNLFSEVYYRPEPSSSPTQSIY